MVIYLDNNATTRVDPDALAAMLPYLSDLYGNPSSMHSFGGQVGAAVQEAREQVAALLGAEDTEIIFNSCGSEGNNTAIQAALAAQPEKRHIVTTAVEHPAILSVCKFLEKKGYSVTYLSVDGRGQLDLMEVEAGDYRRYRPGHHHVRQQRNRGDFPGGSGGGHRQRSRSHLPCGCRAGRRQSAHGHEHQHHRPAHPVGPQAPRPQRRRCPLRPQRLPLPPLPAGWPPGAGSPGRHPQRPRHRRPG
jgi:hypothetical protein